MFFYHLNKLVILDDVSYISMFVVFRIIHTALSGILFLYIILLDTFENNQDLLVVYPYMLNVLSILAVIV